MLEPSERIGASLPTQAGATAGLRRRLVDWTDRHLTIVFNVPTVVLLVGLVAFPVGLVVYTSLTDWFLYTPEARKFVGLHNYLQAWADPRWLGAVWHTFYFAAGSVLVQLVLGLAIALLFNREFKGKTFYRSVFMLPMIAMPTAISLVWIIFFNNTYGLLNYLLWQVFGIPPVEWVSNPAIAIPSLILVQVWQWTPFMTLLILAGLQSLPIDPFEAARIDGATSWQMLRHITLPLLKGHIIVALILRSIFAVKEFDTILTITEGGPNWATETMNMNVYFNAFDYGHTGEAAARGVIFFVFILAIQALLVALRSRSWSH
jgi:multiple sugar transport system permease protein